ncbi:hypothetical protein R6Q57_003497 [Mikania cordata]
MASSSVKRERHSVHENSSSGKKPRVSYDSHSLVGTSLPPITNHRVVLNPADCDLANFVLPKSKDMPGTDEHFDQVVYIELNMTESKRYLDEMKAKLQSGISTSLYCCESSLQSYSSSNPVRYSQDNMMQPYRSLTHHYPLESSTHSSHSASAHYDTSKLQYQMMQAGSYIGQTNKHCNDPNKGRFLPRDDFNHRRSYSGYEHRAAAPIAFFKSCQRTSSDYTPTDETMDLSPQYTANTNYHATPVERNTTSSLSLCNVYDGPSFAPDVDMPTPTPSKYLLATSIPHGSRYGAPDARKPYENHTSYAPN